MPHYIMNFKLDWMNVELDSIRKFVAFVEHI